MPAEEYIDFCPVLTTYLARCSAHRKWDCREPACQAGMSATIDKMIEEEPCPQSHRSTMTRLSS